MTPSTPAPFIVPTRDPLAAPRAWARALTRLAVAPRRGTQPSASTVPLSRGATNWVHKPFGRRVTCESGVLWLCFDGEPLDIVLEPGEAHLCATHSALSIHALSSGVVRLG